MTDFTRNSVLATAFVLILSHFVVCDNNDHGKHAVSYDAYSFKEAMASNRNFVMFFAPWCGHCKNLAPTWDELAKLYNSNKGSPVVISKVDCTVHTHLCADQEIVGFPTLKLFPVGGSEPKRYSGKRDLESLKAYLVQQLNEPAPEAAGSDDKEDAANAGEKATAVTENGLTVLTDATFDDHVSEGLHFIKFYAPWCGHCKRLAPTWDELAEKFADNEFMSISKIDCDANPTSCSRHGVRGYPTLLIFNAGEKMSKYQGERSLIALKAFATEEIAAIHGEDEDEKEEDEPVDHAEPEEAEHEPGTVKELTEANYDSFMASGLVFVKFYAPWCGHCKRLAPTWDDLAKDLQHDAVSVAKVDCTVHKPVCDAHQVRGYPTLQIFRNGEKLEDYRQARSLDSLATFARGFLKPHDEL